ncbi:MAG: tetratricopeptide repeat protein [Candidatus Nanopelagicales bacterium]
MARDDLPSGRVALVFTDIEGSTVLLHSLGADGYADLLARHHALCRTAWDAHGGVVVDTAGDGFFVAFPDPVAAVAAADAAQTSLGEAGIPVRMGVHLGDVEVRETGYVGLDVHRAARIAAVGHGGQILLSADLVAAVPAADVVDLGFHRLKDLPDAERIFQLHGRAFPPLRALFRTNLPASSTPFLGREDDTARLRLMLEDPDVRLVTVVGPGGVGKTRLVQHVAKAAFDRYPGGVWWVPLAAHAAVDEALLALGAVLEIGDVEPGADVVDALARSAGSAPTLVVLDNAEHLMPDIATAAAALLARAPSLTLLASSRQRLSVSAEHVVVLDPLPIGTAVELFLGRAAAAGAAYPADAAVTEICERLDRMPLAIELVAARAPLLPPRQLLQQLQPVLAEASGPLDADDRQRTLQAAVQWSYDLLGPDEQRAFRACSAFVGSASVAAIAAVAEVGLGVVLALVDKSLLRQRDGAYSTRLVMLETVREVAAGLARYEQQGWEQAHASWLRGTVTSLSARNPMRLPPDDLALLRDERDNLRAALRRTEHREPATFVDLASVAWGDLYFGGLVSEAVALLRTALPLADDPYPRALVLHGLVTILYRMGADDVVALAQEELVAAQGSGDRVAEVDAWRNVGLARLALDDDEGTIEASRRSLELAREAGDTWGTVGGLQNIGNSLLNLGRYDEALDLFDEAVDLATRTGDDFGTTLGLSNTADALIALGRADEAVPVVRRVFDHHWAEQRVWAVDVVALVLLARGDAEGYAVLSAAATTGFAALQQPREGLALRRHEEAGARAIELLGRQEHDRLTRRGAGLSLDDAHALARTYLGAL